MDGSEIKKDNNIESLSAFINAAIKHGDATESGDYKSANKAYAQIINAKDDLKNAGKLKLLFELLNHTSISVRLWAAREMLPYYKDESIKVLRDITKLNNIYSLDADTVISEWQKGNLTF
jgi:hypothetical protein